MFSERLPSGIAGWRKWSIAKTGSEGTRPAPLPAGPVPERRAAICSARNMCSPAISWTALFAFLRSWSGVASPLACFSAGIGRRSLIAGIGMPEIISSLGSGILFLWPDPQRSCGAVAVNPASGYISRMLSMVPVVIAQRLTSWRLVSLSKSIMDAGIFFWRTSKVTGWRAEGRRGPK